MRFQIFSGDTIIGSSDLDRLDPPMGIASGDFLPSENYHMVQPVFQLYAEATVNQASQELGLFEQYYRERDNLSLTIRLASGEIVPVQVVHIQDFSVEFGEMEVTIATIPDTPTFGQYFEASAGAA